MGLIISAAIIALLERFELIALSANIPIIFCVASILMLINGIITFIREDTKIKNQAAELTWAEDTQNKELYKKIHEIAGCIEKKYAAILSAVAYAVLATFVMLFSLGYAPMLLVLVPVALFILKFIFTDVYSMKSRMTLRFADDFNNVNKNIKESKDVQIEFPKLNSGTLFKNIVKYNEKLKHEETEEAFLSVVT